jgi:hypothetical protein
MADDAAETPIVKDAFPIAEDEPAVDSYPRMEARVPRSVTVGL